MTRQGVGTDAVYGHYQALQRVGIIAVDGSCMTRQSVGIGAVNVHYLSKVWI